MKHTRSTSGRTHRLTHGSAFVELRYTQAPRFTDQVQGDLIRKYHSTYDENVRVGVLPCTVDTSLDALERERRSHTPECVATVALAAADWEPDYRPTQDEVASLIRAVVRVDRSERDIF